MFDGRDETAAYLRVAALPHVAAVQGFLRGEDDMRLPFSTGAMSGCRGFAQLFL